MASVVEFEIAGVKYRANPMDARRQFHVARRLAGALTSMSGGIEGIGRVLAAMPDADADFVVNECLRVTQRLEGATWADVMAPTGIIMFDDLRTSMAALIQIVVPVLRSNAQDFLSALPKDFLANLIPQAADEPSNSPA